MFEYWKVFLGIVVALGGTTIICTYFASYFEDGEGLEVPTDLIDSEADLLDANLFPEGLEESHHRINEVI